MNSCSDTPEALHPILGTTWAALLTGAGGTLGFVFGLREVDAESVPVPVPGRVSRPAAGSETKSLRDSADGRGGFGTWCHMASCWSP